jgi:hypothetical protein
MTVVNNNAAVTMHVQVSLFLLTFIPSSVYPGHTLLSRAEYGLLELYKSFYYFGNWKRGL